VVDRQFDHRELCGENPRAWDEREREARVGTSASMIREIVASPNGRAKCRRCRKSIEKGEARAAREEDGMFSEPVSAYYHALCEVDVAVDEVAAFLKEGSIAEFPGHEEIRAVVERRARAIEEARKEPAVRNASAMVVEGARDPAGRSRVWAYLAGTSFSPRVWPWPRTTSSSPRRAPCVTLAKTGRSPRFALRSARD
jgi:uncharacterized protein (UPF0147 family)